MNGSMHYDMQTLQCTITREVALSAEQVAA